MVERSTRATMGGRGLVRPLYALLARGIPPGCRALRWAESRRAGWMEGGTASATERRCADTLSGKTTGCPKHADGRRPSAGRARVWRVCAILLRHRYCRGRRRRAVWDGSHRHDTRPFCSAALCRPIRRRETWWGQTFRLLRLLTNWDFLTAELVTLGVKGCSSIPVPFIYLMSQKRSAMPATNHISRIMAAPA
jgi:hypothetical protein